MSNQPIHVYKCTNLITENIQNCVSREEFDSLQRELNYWQNTTINILINNKGEHIMHGYSQHSKQACMCARAACYSKRVQIQEQNLTTALSRMTIS